MEEQKEIVISNNPNKSNMKTALIPLVGNLGLNKNRFIKHVQRLWINSGSKQNVEHDYDRIYDMFDLSRILRIRVLEIPG